MEGLMQPNRLRARILMWTEEEIRLGGLPAQSGAVLDALLCRGELLRGEVAAIVGTGDRQGAPRRLGPQRPWRAYVGKYAVGAAPGLSCRARRALDARVISGSRNLIDSTGQR